MGRREIRDLAHQLAPDAAPGAGHQDALAFDQASHGDAIQRRLRAAQQILDGEWLDLELVGDAALEIGEAGQPGQGHPRSSAVSKSARTLVPSMSSLVRIRRCGRSPVRSAAPPRRNGVQGPQHFDARG